MIRFHKPEKMEVLSDEEHQTQMKTSFTSQRTFQSSWKRIFPFLEHNPEQNLCSTGFALNVI